MSELRVADPNGPDVWDHAPLVFPGAVYRERARAVYWDSTTPACRVGGPSYAECLLNPGHEGDHYGNGFDDYGPKGPTRWKQRPMAGARQDDEAPAKRGV